MAVLGMWGFDDGAGEPNQTLGGGSLNDTANSRTGAGGCWTGPGTSGIVNVQSIIPATTNFVFGFGARFQSTNTGTFCYVTDGVVVHLALRLTSAGGLNLYMGDGVTLLATSSTTPFSITNVWRYIEFKATIDDVAGSVTVRVDGTTILTYSGDTRNGSTATVTKMILFNLGNPGTTYYDDVYALDNTGVAPYNDFLGDIVVRTLLPNGDGDSSGWLGSDGNSVNNSLLVDEPTSSMTDYVAANVSSTSDLYALTDVPSTYDVLAVREVVYAAKSDGGVSPVVLPQAKGTLGTVRTDTALPALSTTPLPYGSDIRTTDPDGNALNATRLNAMQIGVQIQ